jgi:transposase-like protein
MNPDRNSYDAAFKSEAVRLAMERNNVASVARELGIAASTLQRWVNLARQHPENPMVRDGSASSTLQRWDDLATQHPENPLSEDGNDMVQSSTMTENKCDWCGNSCGSSKYCCKKCEFESDKFDEKRKTESSSNTASSTSISNQSTTDVRINVLDEPLSFLVSECKHLLALIPVLAIHLAVMNLEPYKTFCQYLPTQFHNSPLDDGVSGQTNNVISFILSFLPLATLSTLTFRFPKVILWIMGIVIFLGLVLYLCVTFPIVASVVGIIVVCLFVYGFLVMPFIDWLEDEFPIAANVAYVLMALLTIFFIFQIWTLVAKGGG